MGLKEAWHKLYFGNGSKLLMSWMPDLKFSRTALSLSPTKSSVKPWLWPGFKRVDHVLRVTGSARDSINVKPKSNLLLGAGRVFWGGSYWARLFFFVPFGSTGVNWFSDEAWYATIRYFFHTGMSANRLPTGEPVNWHKCCRKGYCIWQQQKLNRFKFHVKLSR